MITRNNLSSLNSFCVLSRLVKLKEHVKLDSLTKYISLIVINSFTIPFILSHSRFIAINLHFTF